MAALHSISKGQLRMQLQEVAGPAVAVYPAFRKVLGLNATAAQFLSQAVYWTERTADGWFYKTEGEWEDEIGLSPKEVRTARKNLAALHLLEEVRKGVPAKIHYRVNVGVLFDLLSCPNGTTRPAQKVELVLTEGEDKTCPNGTTITEITTEITSSSAQGADVIELFAGSEFRPMTLGWEPDQKILKAYAVAQGVNLSLITKELIAGFSCHFSAHPETCDTAAGWNNRLVKWAKSEKVRVEADSAAVDEAGVPVDKIIDLYHRTCPSLAPVSVTTDRNLRARIVERWNESEAQQSSVFWKGFFLKANLRNEVFYGGERVKPRLEALVSRSVFRAIVEAEQ
ncbi:DnaT-like ssDNA-binding domain-containing protein [Azotobacter chroococcum]|uniref:DnaT DNA-binding domain-containing protein n=1 Tax=Azotobacter chroococcum TaxID=353 RepID=A0AAP9YFN8_9GAMM|nr:DnaT-like ssDNA-binding domain-containing protein [Azotobacter chroococcum]QQE90455.1 hypothetical protein GKQ51_09360 [Azotobacter chroococcum]